MSNETNNAPEGKTMAAMSVVDEVLDERALGHGWWYYLKPGWKREGYNTHALRADTKRKINQILRDEVVKCDCKDCQP